jgi:hypothetical protein
MNEPTPVINQTLAPPLDETENNVNFGEFSNHNASNKSI